MAVIPDYFDLDYEGTLLNVQTLHLTKQTIFKITSASGTVKPLKIGRAESEKGGKFWTCFPEDAYNHDLATKIGPLIEKYYRSLQQ